jgi:hypothetical protein
MVVDNINDSFTIVFLVEAMIKILGLGGLYFKQSQNQLDFFLLIVSLISLVTHNTIS